MIRFTVTRLPGFNLDWWGPTQKQWAPILLKTHEVPWRQESDPTTGRPWKALTLSYRKRKDRQYPGQPILRATGRMQDTAKILPKGEGFEVITTPYGAYHQFGTRFMTSRPWVGIPDTSLQKIVPIAWRNILKRSRSS